jgi:hypothetical protein
MTSDEIEEEEGIEASMASAAASAIDEGAGVVEEYEDIG